MRKKQARLRPSNDDLVWVSAPKLVVGRDDDEFLSTLRMAPVGVGKLRNMFTVACKL